MLLKNVVFAVVAVLAVSGSAFADDLMSELQTADLASINDAGAELEEMDLNSLDVDQMAEEAGEESDAVEACFRRFGGYHSGGWNNWCGYNTYNYCYSNYHTYSYSYCYRPMYCYRPVVSCYTTCLPVVTSYWGCY